MTAEDFRQLALGLEGAIESAHMDHPDFRVAGKIFATIGYPDNSTGMVKLPLGEQQRLVETMPDAFTPAAGAWGRGGSTLVRLDAVKPEVLRHALIMAWERARAKGQAKPKRRA